MARGSWFRSRSGSESDAKPSSGKPSPSEASPAKPPDNRTVLNPTPASQKSTSQTSLAKTPDVQTSPKEKPQMSPESTGSKGAVPTAAPATAGAKATIRYLDRADMEETFADSITGLIFDGQTLRIEFGVTRFDDVTANTPISGRRYPACRLVLPPAAAVDLINRMQQIAAALTQAGVVRSRGGAAEAPKAG